MVSYEFTYLNNFRYVFTSKSKTVAFGNICFQSWRLLSPTLSAQNVRNFSFADFDAHDVDFRERMRDALSALRAHDAARTVRPISTHEIIFHALYASHLLVVAERRTHNICIGCGKAVPKPSLVCEVWRVEDESSIGSCNRSSEYPRCDEIA